MCRARSAVAGVVQHEGGARCTSSGIFSINRLDLADAILVINSAGERTAIEANPLWQRLPAVQPPSRGNRLPHHLRGR